MVDFAVELIANFIEGVLELATKPWADKMNRKWKARKKK